MSNVRKRKLTQRLASTLVSILLVAVSAFFIMSIVSAHLETSRLEKKLAERKDEFAQLERDQDELKKQKEKLSDPEYIKDYARGNFMLSEENEQIFILPSKGN